MKKIERKAVWPESMQGSAPQIVKGSFVFTLTVSWSGQHDSCRRHDGMTAFGATSGECLASMSGWSSRAAH